MLLDMKLFWFLSLISYTLGCNHHDGDDEEDSERFVVKCRLENNEERYILQKMVLNHDLDLWSEGIPKAPAEVTLLLEPNQVDMVMSNLACHAPKSMVQYRLEKSIVGNQFEFPFANLINFTEQIGQNKTTGISGFFGAYQGYQTIVNEVQAKAKSFPTLVKKIGSLGKSIEGRSIPVIHLCSNPMSVKNRKLIW